MKKKFLILIFVLLLFPLKASAADAVTLPKYITSLYSIGLIVAGVTAMIMLIYAGYQYMVGGINANTISGAKSTATNALLGLILLIASGLILRTIDPAFLEFSWQGFDFEGKLDWITENNRVRCLNDGGVDYRDGHCVTPAEQEDPTVYEGSGNDDTGVTRIGKGEHGCHLDDKRCEAGLLCKEKYTDKDGKPCTVGDYTDPENNPCTLTDSICE